MLKKLNAKIYCFDKDKIIITSSNFTNKGLKESNEYGILIRKKRMKILIILEKKQINLLNLEKK